MVGSMFQIFVLSPDTSKLKSSTEGPGSTNINTLTHNIGCQSNCTRVDFDEVQGN